MLIQIQKCHKKKYRVTRKNRANLFRGRRITSGTHKSFSTERVLKGDGVERIHDFAFQEKTLLLWLIASLALPVFPLGGTGLRKAFP